MSLEQDEATGAFIEMVTDLAHQIEILREAIDELRDELTYELRKLRDAVTTEREKPFRLTSMPRDPCAPDFHTRVNSVEPHSVPATSETPTELLIRLLHEDAVGQLTANDWDLEQQLTPDKTFEISPITFDGFAESFELVLQGEDHFVADDGQGNRYLVWCREECCFARLLTTDQQNRLEELADNSLPKERKSNSPNADPSSQASRSTQRSLW